VKYFACALSSGVGGVPAWVKTSWESQARRRHLDSQWHRMPHAVVFAASDDPAGTSLIARCDGYTAVGIVQLDNRAEIERWIRPLPGPASDLELVLRVFARHGTARITDLVGDFAFVVCEDETCTAFAVSDALEVRKLYYTTRDGLVAFASRAEALAAGDAYDLEYLTEIVADCYQSPDLTPYAGVRKLAGGTFARIERGSLATHRYWSPDRFRMERMRPELEREAPAEVRRLLAESVRSRLARSAGTWAHLSGGLDSSSIVSVAQWLVETGSISKGLAGTVSYVDGRGTEADEREYSDAVVGRWAIRNESIVESPLWHDDEEPPPQMDQPSGTLPFYPRERKMCRVVQRAGGRALLTGFAGDELLTGNTLFFADWVVHGRIWPAVREMARWTAIGRVSFWQIAHENVVMPLLPLSIRRPKSVNHGALLPWLTDSVARRYDIRSRVAAAAALSGRIGNLYHSSVLTNVRAISRALDDGVAGETFDIHYPFLYRPLVEYVLTLPPELCARPQQRKWVLREAMRGILPESVRTRIGKGSTSDILARSLARQREVLQPLVTSPILADLGIIDATQLRAAFDAAPLTADTGRDLSTDVQSTLSVEAWLQIRAGRWPRGAVA
jgi:asparagine synthase (glutamine-hydrolysing)